MRIRRGVLLPSLAVLVVAAGALTFALASDGEGPPELLARALDIMPRPAGGADLYFTAQPGTLESVYGFAPGRVDGAVERAYGIRGDDITAVLERGGPASTVLLGSFRTDEITTRFESIGYSSQSRGGWTELVATDLAQGPLAAGAEAVALRGDAMVIGTADEIAAVVRGDTAVQRDALLRAVPAEATVVALGPSYDEMVGDDVAAPGPDGGPQRYTAWLLALWGEGEQRQGVVAQAYDDAGAAAAGQLAGRIDAAPTIGGRAEAIVVEPRQPQWDADSGVATVAVVFTARGPAAVWGQLRGWLERGEADFLRQP